MKNITLALCLFFVGNALAQEKQINIKLNPAILSISGDNNGSGSNDQKPLVGMQVGAGLFIPFIWNVLSYDGFWFYNPMLLYTPGGQAYKSGDYIYGDCWYFLNIPNTVGYSLPVKDKQSVQLEAGPSLNFLTGAKNIFTNSDGETEKEKVDLSNNDAFNRVSVSAVIEASYTLELPRFDVSVGLKGDFGMTPTVTYEDFNGDKTKLKANTVALTLEISNPINDLWGNSKYGDYGDMNIQIEPEVWAAETTYDLAILGFKKARAYRDSSLQSENPDSSKYYAEQSLSWTKRAREWVNLGKNEWNDGNIEGGVGPSSDKMISELLGNIEELSTTLKDSVWIVPKREIVETPIDSADGTDPRDTPPSVAYGEEIDLGNLTWEGQFEASQGVWQDDNNFKDKATKQLTKLDEHSNNAELDLVANRWTGVFGTRDDIRYRIKINGTSTYTKKIPVKLRLKLLQEGSEEVVWTETHINTVLPLAGPLGEKQDWEISRMGMEGSPIPKQFKMKPGAYRLVLEVIKDNGEETGIQISSSGDAVETKFPTVNLVPLNLTNNNTINQVRTLRDEVTKVAVACESEFPFLFPIPENALNIIAHPVSYMGNDDLSTIESIVALIPFTDTREEVRKDKVIARIIDRFGSSSRVNGGKTVVFLRESEFDEIYRDPEGMGGFAPNSKVLFIKGKTYASTIAHELIHSMPYIFSRDQMTEICDLNYHNFADNDYGDGARVSSTQSKVISSEDAILGDKEYSVHPTQCTFWHLTKHLQSPVDPELYLIRGFVYQDDSLTIAKLASSYELMGEEELLNGDITPGGWGIILRDKNGMQLASFPFTPNFKDSEYETPHSLVALNFLINRPKGVAKIELVGPNGVLDAQDVSLASPKLRITYPEKNSAVTPADGIVKAEWEATDKDGDDLHYLVYYSPDGEKWRPVTGEQTETFANVKIIGNPPNPMVKVLCTDGVRTEEKIVKFYVLK